MTEPITNLADAVAALGALPMGVDLAPLELSEQQIEALAEAGNRVVNDAVHERLCMCDAWPERCVSTGNYYMGAWDVSGLEDALPAVLALWEQMRGGELLALRARVAELETSTVFRASSGSVLLSLYSGEEDALSHCEDAARRGVDRSNPMSWRKHPDGTRELRAWTSRDVEGSTGFTVAPIEVRPEFDEGWGEDAHESPLHHSYLVPRDLPQPGGA